MDFEQALELVNLAMMSQMGRSLNDIETAILQGSWNGQTYDAIAEASGYAGSYLTRDAGPRFWKLLSQVLNEPMSKTSFRAALERQRKKRSEPQREQNKEQNNTQNNEHYADRQHAVKETRPIGSFTQATNTVSIPAAVAVATPSTPQPSLYCDWGEAVDVHSFSGRAEDLAILKQWIVSDRCRLIALLGMGGIGKSFLSVKLAQAIQDDFDVIIWRSLRNAPPLEQLMSDVLVSLSRWQLSGQVLPGQPVLGQSVSEQASSQVNVRHVLQGLRTARCLLVLDNVETILQAGDRVGQYRSGYEGYGDFFRSMAESEHRSCLVLTSREKPAEVAAFEGIELRVHSLQLVGSEDVARNVLDGKQLIGSDQDKLALCQQYGYNPLALKIVATSIQELFDGDIQSFLAQDTTVFSNVRKLLDQHFDRLSPLEQTIMYWLAINREWTTIAELAADIIPAVSRSALLEAMESLRWRSLIEKAKPTLNGKQMGGYTQQPVVMEYVSDRFIQQIVDEITNNSPISFSSMLNTHALIKAEAKDYIRTTQINLVLQPVITQLITVFGNLKGFEERLVQIRSHLQHHNPLEIGYGAGNIINLLCQANVNLTGHDFSNLSIRQAYLEHATLHRVNFANANLQRSTFTSPLSAVFAVAFSGDGQRFATADVEGEVWVWNASDARLLHVFQGHINWVHSVQFSPDGCLLASGSEDATIRLWDIQAQTCLHVLPGHTNRVRSVAFSPDGCLLASGSDDETIRLWNVETGQCLEILHGHTGGIASIAFVSQDILVSGSTDKTIRLWSIAAPNTRMETSILRSENQEKNKGRNKKKNEASTTANPSEYCIKTIEAHEDGIWSVACSPARSNQFPITSTNHHTHAHYLLASSSRDRTIKVWSLDIIQSNSPFPDSATAPETVTIECLDCSTSRSSWSWSVVFSADGETLASAGDDGAITLWNIDSDTGSIDRPTVLQGHTSRVRSVVFSPTNRQLVSGSKDQTIRLWDLGANQCIKTVKGYTNWVQTIAFSPNAQTIASGHEDWNVRLWDVNTGRCLNTLHGHTQPVWSVAFSPNGHILASSSEDRSILLWNPETGERILTLNGHSSRIWSVTFSPNGETLASGSGDHTIKLWNVRTGECLKTLRGHSSRIWSVTFSPNGETLASGSGDRTIKLWNVHTGECVGVLTGHEGWIFSVSISPNGKTLASAGSDHRVKIWNLETGDCIRTIEEYARLVLSVQFSPDGRTIATANDDHAIRVWDVQTGECLKSLESHTGWVWSIAFSPNDKIPHRSISNPQLSDRQIVVSASQDETIKCWDPNTGQCLHTLSVLRPYEGMNITGTTGITDVQKIALKALGAVIHERTHEHTNEPFL